MKSKAKFQFTLKNIDVQEVNKKYNLDEAEDVEEKTLISDLLQKDLSNKTQNFLFEKDKEVYVSMIENIPLENENKLCFWCSESFTSFPIFCPVKYKPDVIVELCNSKVTNENYIISQYLSKHKCITKDENQVVISHDKYYVDGMFCSFNCCLAYIQDNDHNPFYKMSKFLLFKMYNQLFVTDANKKITPAPHWRMLQKYGGHLSIEEFRATFSSKNFTRENFPLLENIKIKPIGYTYRENIIF